MAEAKAEAQESASSRCLLLLAGGLQAACQAVSVERFCLLALAYGTRLWCVLCVLIQAHYWILLKSHHLGKTSLSDISFIFSSYTVLCYCTVMLSHTTN